MQTERQTVTSAAGSDLKGLPIAANEFELDGRLRHEQQLPISNWQLAKTALRTGDGTEFRLRHTFFYSVRALV